MIVDLIPKIQWIRTYEASNLRAESAKLVCTEVPTVPALRHVLRPCFTSQCPEEVSCSHPSIRPTFEVVTEVDLVPQRVTKNDSHKLFVPRPLHILPTVAVSVARVMLESKWDPDGLTTLTTQNTGSKVWWLQGSLSAQTIRKLGIFTGPVFLSGLL